MTLSGLAAKAEAEVHARHAFFVDWFAGRADETAFGTARRAFDPAFVRIPADGGAPQDLDAVFAMLAGKRGALVNDFAIDTEVESWVEVSETAGLLRYVERQRTPAGPTARRASALFLDSPAAPEGVAWRWLQETWITA